MVDGGWSVGELISEFTICLLYAMMTFGKCGKWMKFDKTYKNGKLKIYTKPTKFSMQKNI
jgi:hypothetical protein